VGAAVSAKLPQVPEEQFNRWAADGFGGSLCVDARTNGIVCVQVAACAAAEAEAACENGL
jgi:hypothetical protein